MRMYLFGAIALRIDFQDHVDLGLDQISSFRRGQFQKMDTKDTVFLGICIVTPKSYMVIFSPIVNIIISSVCGMLRGEIRFCRV